MLLVNDEPMNLMIMEHLFTSNQTNVSRSNNGHDAYVQSMAFQFDIIIMDLEMPVMNGYESTIKIKKYYQDSQFPYIVAFTSNELTEELIAKLRGSRFDDWFTTPVTQQVIQSGIIDRCLQMRDG